MTVQELAIKMEFSVAAGAKAFNKEVCGCYIGDLLSRVISRSKPSGAWITIMTNVNVAAVALLSDVACVILAEDVEPDPPLIERCDIEGIPLLRSKLDAYTIACGLKEII